MRNAGRSPRKNKRAVIRPPLLKPPKLNVTGRSSNSRIGLAVFTPGRKLQFRPYTSYPVYVPRWGLVIIRIN